MRTTNHPSNLTDEQLARLESLLSQGRPNGRTRTISFHDIIDGILCINWTGAQWRTLPKDCTGGRYY